MGRPRRAGNGTHDATSPPRLTWTEWSLRLTESASSRRPLHDADGAVRSRQAGPRDEPRTHAGRVSPPYSGAVAPISGKLCITPLGTLVRMDGAEIEAALGEVCGQLNAAHARLVALVGEVLASRCWEGAGILTCEQWVAWKTGLSPSRARDAGGRGQPPEGAARHHGRLRSGGAGRGSGGVVARHVPADCEAQAADLARLATVSQLRRSLSRYQFHPDPAPDPVQPQPDPCGVSGWYNAQGR